MSKYLNNINCCSFATDKLPFNKTDSGICWLHHSQMASCETFNAEIYQKMTCNTESPS